MTHSHVSSSSKSHSSHHHHKSASSRTTSSQQPQHQQSYTATSQNTYYAHPQSQQSSSSQIKSSSKSLSKHSSSKSSSREPSYSSYGYGGVIEIQDDDIQFDGCNLAALYEEERRRSWEDSRRPVQGRGRTTRRTHHWREGIRWHFTFVNLLLLRAMESADGDVWLLVEEGDLAWIWAWAIEIFMGISSICTVS